MKVIVARIEAESGGDPSLVELAARPRLNATSEHHAISVLARE